MIRKCALDDTTDIFSYIGCDYPLCLYLYLDLKKYGLESDTINVYIQYDGNQTTALLLKYYSCIHVFSKDNSFDPLELTNFLAQQDFSMVYCTAKTAVRIYTNFKEEMKSKSVVTKGWVAQILNIDEAPRKLAVLAQPGDFKQIVKMIYSDEDIGKNYKYEELVLQLEKRNREGFARNFVIKQNELVIAHACTNAELDNISVVAELIVREEYRRKGLATEIWRDICGTLLSEHKEVYSFYYSEESRNLHKKIGFHEICEWAKIVLS